MGQGEDVSPEATRGFRMRLVWAALLLAGLAAAQTYPFIPIKGVQQLGAIVHDRRGMLWVSNNRAIYVSDGQRILRPELPHLGKMSARALTESQDGSIWAGGDGLYRIDPIRGLAEHVADGTVTGVIARRDGVVIAGIGPSGGGIPDIVQIDVIRKTGDRWKVSALEGVRARGALTADRSGNVLFACPGGWCELDSGLHVVRHALTGLLPFRVMRDSQNCIWFRDEHQAAYDCGDGHVNTLSSEFASANPLSQLAELGDGSVLLISSGGIAIGRPGRFAVARLENGLPAGCVDAVFAADGTMFVTSDSGLFRWAWPFRLEYWGRDAGVEDPNSILRINGQTFIGSTPGIRKLSSDRRHWNVITRGEMAVLALIPAGLKSMYATVAEGMLREIGLDGRILRETPQGFGSASRVAMTRDGQVWVSGPGLLRIKQQGRFLVPESVLPGEPHFGQDVRIDAEGRIWGCYSGGIAYLDGREWKHITTQDGLIQNKCRSMAFDRNGDLWYGYNTAQAFARVHLNADGKPTVENFRAGGEVGDPGVHFIDTDTRGWIWRGAGNGVYVASADEARRGLWLRLADVDGLPENMTNQRAFFADPDGSVWFGTANYVVHFLPPGDLLTPRRAAAPFVTAVSVDGQAPSYAASPYSIPVHNNVALSWGSQEWAQHSALRIRYRVGGQSQGWKEVSEEERESGQIALGRLPGGSHQLFLESALFAGPWSQEYADDVVVGSAPFGWSLLWVAGLGSVFLIGSFLLRGQWVVTQAATLPSLVAWRKQVFTDTTEAPDNLIAHRYRLTEPIAHGGFATVWLAQDLQEPLDGACAVKIFDQAGSGEWLMKQAQAEIKALSGVVHPNIARLRGHGVTGGGLFFVAMDYIEGTTLRAVLVGEKLPPQRVGFWLMQLGAALDELHGRGIFHRDVKPENIMLRREANPGEELVLIDFSIALLKEPGQTLQTLSRVVGSLDYMAPEHVLGFADEATDIFSMGKLAVEMLAGGRFSELASNGTIDLPGQARRVLAERCPNLSEKVRDEIASAVAFDPALRPRRAGEFAKRVAQALICE